MPDQFNQKPTDQDTQTWDNAKQQGNYGAGSNDAFDGDSQSQNSQDSDTQFNGGLDRTERQDIIDMENEGNTLSDDETVGKWIRSNSQPGQ